MATGLDLKRALDPGAQPMRSVPFPETAKTPDPTIVRRRGSETLQPSSRRPTRRQGRHERLLPALGRVLGAGSSGRSWEGTAA